MLELEQARLRDVGALLALRDDAARWLLKQGIQQWQPDEFPRSRMRSWAQAGYIHVLRQRAHLAACVAVLWDDPEIWGESSDAAGYVHLLIVDQDSRGTGLGGEVLHWAEQHIRGKGRMLSRLDAVSSNKALHDWYERRGYAEVGQRRFEDSRWFPVTLREKQV